MQNASIFQLELALWLTVLAVTWIVLGAPVQGRQSPGTFCQALGPLMCCPPIPDFLRSGGHWSLHHGSQPSRGVPTSVVPMALAPPQRLGVGLPGMEVQGWPGLGESGDGHEHLLALFSHGTVVVPCPHCPGGETKVLQEEDDTVRASVAGLGLQPRSQEAWSGPCGCGGAGASSFILSSIL